MSELQFFEYNSSKQDPKYLVIFLHGYGANGANLLDLSHEFAHVLPDAHFVSPNAPQNWEGGFIDSYQWFSLNGVSLVSGNHNNNVEKIAAEIKKSQEILNNFVQSQLERFKLGIENLFLVGFSQGAMMAMYQGFMMPKKPAGIISYSGKLILPEHLGEVTISKPDICLVHGQEDSVVPFDNFLQAEQILQALKIPFESHAVPHIDHTIDIHGVKAGKNFIKKILTK